MMAIVIVWAMFGAAIGFMIGRAAFQPEPPKRYKVQYFWDEQLKSTVIFEKPGVTDFGLGHKFVVEEIK